MPWCPNCKSEYREGFKICTDCDSELVAELDVVIKKTEEKEENSDDKWVLFFETFNEREAEIVQSILESAEIPVIRKDKGAGGYLKVTMGMNNLGVDLYVPEFKLKEAINLLPPRESKFENEAEEQLVMRSNEREPRIEKKHKTYSWVYFLYVAIPMVIYLIYTFWNSIRNLFRMEF